MWQQSLWENYIDFCEFYADISLNNQHTQEV